MIPPITPRCLRLILLCVATATLGTSCLSNRIALARKPFDTPAYRPTDRDKVSVKVSLKNRMVYVKEGDRTLLTTPTCVGRPDTPTPVGNFRAFNRLPRKRSNTYGFHLHPGRIDPGKRSDTPSGARYVGYPMPYWIEFKSGYGFHSGSVWPEPRSHGCLRIHRNVAPTFFDLVRPGTRINIAYSQPEDASDGRNVPRPSDFADPDPPANYITTQKYFDDHPSQPNYIN